MASITIRNLDEDVKAQLRMRAVGNGRSMEEEARLILREAVSRKTGPENLASAIRNRFVPLGGVELKLPPREPPREPPRFE
ncbi:MAG: plasmid stabilization protein [Nitrospira sp. SB0677_bin_15]|nr:plasmid stabilization protein [Nitrospira sp. SB0667_bin_9]MYD30076.1 plasmid stabilization protein [Nitrospira sp. SB0661_bin_20]MYG40535.1 plasmid stabilization protein [Nitrospira sp. SB0677_bin_15]MYJ22421.1 plasmid stabilization protein [Nitrospira sp. SB0673_bin_12]